MKGNIDQYIGLRTAYIDIKMNQVTPNKKKSSEDTTDDDKINKNSEICFKNKYKTEMCKFWEINNSCKFGNKVMQFSNLVCICAWKL